MPSRYSGASRKQVTTFFWLPSRYSGASRKQVTTFFRVPSRYSGASREQVTNRFMLPSRLPSLECIEVISKYSWCKGCPGPKGKHRTRGEPSIEPLSNYCPKWRNSRTVEKTRFIDLVHYMSHHSNPELSLHWAATVSCQRSVCQVPGRWHHSVCQCVLAEGDSVSEVGDLNGQSRQNLQWWGCKRSCSSGAGLCPTWPGTWQWRTSQCPQCPLCWRQQQHSTSRGGWAWHSLLTLLTSSFQRRLGWLFHQLHCSRGWRQLTS